MIKRICWLSAIITQTKVSGREQNGDERQRMKNVGQIYWLVPFASTSYTYGSLWLGSATTSGSSVYYTRDSSGKLISERTPSGTYYYLTNNIGSVILVTDSTGKVQNSYSYDPLGNSLGKTENVTNPWQFAGGYLDATTGLYKFGTRYYNPTVGSCAWHLLLSRAGT